MADSSAATAAAQKLAEDGLRAIRELERVLLFTDLKDEDNIASQTAAANQALQNLQSVTTTSTNSREDEGEAKLEHFDILPPRSDRTSQPKLKQPEPSSSTVTSSNMSTALLVSLSAKWKELVDRLLLRLEATLESGSQTWQETERTLLFTDMDEIYNKHDAVVGRPTSYRSRSTTTLAKPDNSLNVTLLLLQIQEQVKILLKELELKMGDLQQTTVHAVKECERTLLFTDLPDTHDATSGSPRSYRTSSTTTLAKPNVTLPLLQIEEHLKALLIQLELKMSGMQQSTVHAVKACERSLLFTDIPDQSPLRSKQDAVHHFVNSQQVMEELQRKVFFSDCK